MSQFFASGGQSIGVSASASVPPINIHDWFPLGWTGWISLQSKGLSGVFSNTTVQKHQFFGGQLYSPNLTSVHDYWKNIALTRRTLVGKVVSLLFFFFNFYFYFIFLYNTVLVLPYIDMNPPRVYMRSQTWTPPPTFLPITSLWVITVHQPQACCILLWTYTGDSILTW